MDDTLKRLLGVEQAAGERVAKAQSDSESLVQAALQDASQQAQRFEARIPELHASFVDKSEQRARQQVAEMERRFQERLTQLRSAAEAHEEKALEAAFLRLLGDATADRP